MKKASSAKLGFSFGVYKLARFESDFRGTPVMTDWGTAFAVGPRHLLTAYHCIDPSCLDSTVCYERLSQEHRITVKEAGKLIRLLEFDEERDWALVETDFPCHQRLYLSPPDSETTFNSYGFPETQPEDGLAVTGTIVNLDGAVNGFRRMQLSPLTANFVPKGASGSPIVVSRGPESCVIGILVESRFEQAGDFLYACHVDEKLVKMLHLKAKVEPRLPAISNRDDLFSVCDRTSQKSLIHRTLVEKKTKRAFFLFAGAALHYPTQLAKGLEYYIPRFSSGPAPIILRLYAADFDCPTSEQFLTELNQWWDRQECSDDVVLVYQVSLKSHCEWLREFCEYWKTKALGNVSQLTVVVVAVYHQIPPQLFTATLSRFPLLRRVLYGKSDDLYPCDIPRVGELEHLPAPGLIGFTEVDSWLRDYAKRWIAELYPSIDIGHFHDSVISLVDEGEKWAMGTFADKTREIIDRLRGGARV